MRIHEGSLKLVYGEASDFLVAHDGDEDLGVIYPDLIQGVSSETKRAIEARSDDVKNLLGREREGFSKSLLVTKWFQFAERRSHRDARSEIEGLLMHLQVLDETSLTEQARLLAITRHTFAAREGIPELVFEFDQFGAEFNLYFYGEALRRGRQAAILKKQIESTGGFVTDTDADVPLWARGVVPKREAEYKALNDGYKTFLQYGQETSTALAIGPDASEKVFTD